MTLVALLFAHHGAGADGEPNAALPVAGVSVIERQVALAKSCGAARVLVAVERMPAALAAALARAKVEIVRTSVGFSLGDATQVLVIADSLLVDRRAIAAVLAKEPPALAVWKGRIGHDGAERIDAASHWGGIGLYPARMVADTLADLGEWDLQATLLRAAYTDARPARVDLAAIPALESPLQWQPIRGAQEAEETTQGQLAASDGEVPDWPTWLALARLEKALTSFAIARDVTPGLIGAAAGALGVGAAIAFAAGWLWGGLISAMLCLPLFASARRLSATLKGNAVTPPWHTPELLLQFLWFAALSLALWRTQGVAPTVAATLLITANWATAFLRGGYRRLTARSLDQAGRFETNLRRFGGQDNALIWSLIPFAIFGLWWPGFLVTTFYATATFVLSLVRLFVRLEARPTPATRPVKSAPRDVEDEPAPLFDLPEAASNEVSGL